MTKRDMLEILEPFDDGAELKVDQPEGPQSISLHDGVVVRDGAIILRPRSAWRWDSRRRPSINQTEGEAA